jgi:hypothetical protein
MRFPWQLLMTTVFLTACTSMCGVNRSSMTPEQVVEAYLDVALNMTDVDQRDLLLDYTTGNLKAAIEGATPDTIRTAYVDRKYKILNYSVVERRDRTPRETEVSFQLTYNDLGTEGKAATDAPKVTTENTVSVVKENGVWLIKDVLGHKTSIDFPISEESKITAKPGPGTDDEETAPPPEEDAAPAVDAGEEQGAPADGAADAGAPAGGAQPEQGGGNGGGADQSG